MGCENWFSFAEHRRKRHQVSFKQTRIQLKVLTFAKGQMWACMKKKKKKNTQTQNHGEYRYKRILYLLTGSSLKSPSVGDL